MVDMADHIYHHNIQVDIYNNQMFDRIDFVNMSLFDMLIHICHHKILNK